MFLLIFIILSIAGCSATPAPLNSERIEQRFGSYGVEVLQADYDLRISNLYSIENGDKICRTYAVVETGPPHAEYAREVQRILSGESIGAVFKEAGWQIHKETLSIGQIEITDSSQRIVQLMRIEAPAVLASHRYVFRVSRRGQSFDYAIISETHHPDYLGIDDLLKLYNGDSREQTANEIEPCPAPICM